MRIPLERRARVKSKDREQWQRFDSSVARARTAVKELAMCNPWSWFVTLTLSGEKVSDRHDLEEYHLKLTQYIKGLNKRRSPERKISYILVPERHKNGAWHMHGLMQGLDEQDVKRNEHGYYDWWPYRRNFGWISLGRIKSRMGVIGYICKYISKSLAADLDKTGATMYYRSRGLIEPTEYYKDFEGEYLGRWDFKNTDIGLKLAYTPNPDKICLPEPGEYDTERELRDALERLEVLVPETPEQLWDVLEGFDPLVLENY